MSLTNFITKVRRELLIRRSQRAFLNVMRKLQGNYTPKEKLEFACRAVSKLRKGQDNTDTNFSIDMINEALEAGWNYRKIGISKEELIEFRNGKSQKIFAAKTLEGLRGGISYSTYAIRKLVKEDGFSWDELGTSEEELTSLDRAFEVKIRKMQVQELRIMASTNFDEARVVLRKNTLHFSEPEPYFQDVAAKEKFLLTPEEVGVTKEGCAILIKKAFLNLARLELENIKEAADEGCLLEPSGAKEKNNYYSMTHIDKLKCLIQKAEASLSDIGSSEDELISLLKNSKKRRQV